MEHRILITQWVGNAWQELCSSKYDQLRDTPDTTENDEEKEEAETLDEALQKPGNDGKEFEDCENDRK